MTERAPVLLVFMAVPAALLGGVIQLFEGQGLLAGAAAGAVGGAFLFWLGTRRQ